MSADITAVTVTVDETNVTVATDVTELAGTVTIDGGGGGGLPDGATVIADAVGYWIAENCPAEGVVGSWANEGTGGSTYDIPVDGGQTPLTRFHSYFYNRQQLRVDRDGFLQSLAFQGTTHGVRPPDAQLPGNLITFELDRIETDGSSVPMVQAAIYVDADYTVHWTGTAWEGDRLTYETFDVVLATPMPASVSASVPAPLTFTLGGGALGVTFGADSASWFPTTIWLSGAPFNNGYEFDVDRPAHIRLNSGHFDNWYFVGTYDPVPGFDAPKDTVPFVDNLGINLSLLPALAGSDFTVLTWGDNAHLRWDTGQMSCKAEPFVPTLLTFGSGVSITVRDTFTVGRNPADVYRFEGCGARWDASAGQWSIKAANVPWVPIGPTATDDPEVDPLAATLLLRQHAAARLGIWTRLLTADEAEAVFKVWFAAYPPLLG